MDLSVLTKTVSHISATFPSMDASQLRIEFDEFSSQFNMFMYQLTILVALILPRTTLNYSMPIEIGNNVPSNIPNLNIDFEYFEGDFTFGDLITSVKYTVPPISSELTIHFRFDTGTSSVTFTQRVPVSDIYTCHTFYVPMMFNLSNNNICNMYGTYASGSATTLLLPSVVVSFAPATGGFFYGMPNQGPLMMSQGPLLTSQEPLLAENKTDVPVSNVTSLLNSVLAPLKSQLPVNLGNVTPLKNDHVEPKSNLKTTNNENTMVSNLALVNALLQHKVDISHVIKNFKK